MVVEYLRKHRELIFIDVTNAQSAAAGNGNAYFRKSPWVSSDVLMTLMHNRQPNERGLVQSTDIPVRTFPPDYIQLLGAALIGVNSKPSENLK